MIKSDYIDSLPKIHCYVCGKVVTINADRGKHRNDFTENGSRHFRFFCATCANACYDAAVERGEVLHGWTLAPRWFGSACVTIRRRAEKVK